MADALRLSSVISREGDTYLSFCPELDVASEGETAEQARANLFEALALLFSVASGSEIEQRLRDAPTTCSDNCCD
jgi:predicted RNase H-like HicB family nuclease